MLKLIVFWYNANGNSYLTLENIDFCNNQRKFHLLDYRKYSTI